MCVCVCVCARLHACSVVSNSLPPHGLQPARLLYPWNFPGKNIGAGCHFLFQGISPTQGLNLNLLHPLHWHADSLSLSHLGSPSEKFGYTISIQLTEFLYCCCSVAKSCPTLCNPVDCSTPGSSVLHYLLEFAQIHIHWLDHTI